MAQNYFTYFRGLRSVRNSPPPPPPRPPRDDIQLNNLDRPGIRPGEFRIGR